MKKNERVNENSEYHRYGLLLLLHFGSNGLFRMFMWILRFFFLTSRHWTSDCCCEQTLRKQKWWWWWTSDDVTISSRRLIARLRVSMCNRCMHYLIRRVSNKLLPSFDLGWVTLIQWTRRGWTRHLYRYVWFVALHAIVSYFCAREIDCSDTIEHEKFNVCYCFVYL